MTVSKYKYLGVFLDEFLTFHDCAQILADSAGRALGAIVKLKDLNNCGYNSFFSFITPMLSLFLVMELVFGVLRWIVQLKKIIIEH